MIVYPAIDIRHGRVVRLLHGDPERETVYGDDPAAAAQHWRAAGAAWLHVVSLDGALGEANLALDALSRLTEVGVAVQFGGGLRTLDDVRAALEAGAARVVLGTAAVVQPGLAAAAVLRFGADAVAVALDIRNGLVVTHGWQQTSAWTPAELGRRLAADGVRHVLCTDVGRDGDLSGVNIAATVALARDTGLAVIASGGVASLADIAGLQRSGEVAGVVVGRALYSGAIRLEDALRVASSGPEDGRVPC